MPGALLQAFALLQLLHCGCSTVGLAASPPMGFNNCNVQIALGLSNWTCCSGNQRLFEATAAALKSKGLLQLGYRYINTDDGWMNHDRSHGVGNGTQVPQSGAKRFPDWQGMIDKLHADGFFFGLYTAMGNQSCCKRATSCNNEAVDAQQYARWGIDVSVLLLPRAGQQYSRALLHVTALGAAVRQRRRLLVVPRGW